MSDQNKKGDAKATALQSRIRQVGSDEERTNASPSYEEQLKEFEIFYYKDLTRFTDAVKTISQVLRSVLDERKEELPIHDVSGRVKTFQSCVQKYNKKYRPQTEVVDKKIWEYITDLIGIRVVCLYEDDVKRIAEIIGSTFRVIHETNKIETLNQKVDTFGYKALHCDLYIGAQRLGLEEYRRFADLSIEIQIRTIFQDAWSVIDHQLKYKQEVHPLLARRINMFAALCELADQEFIRIRDDIRRAPIELFAGELSAAGDKKLDLKSFLEILRSNFPLDVILPDQADILLATIQGCDADLTAEMLASFFDQWGSLLREAYEKYKARRQSTLSTLTRIRILLCVADTKKFGSLVNSADCRDLVAEIRKG